MLLAAGAAGVVGAAWLTRPNPLGRRVPRGEPLLRMPFPAGQVVLCEQGNLAPPGQTHALPNNQYAIDLSNAADPTIAVVAAAAGRVVYALGGVDPDDADAGFQYGNHVKIDHGDDYFTLYAHLDRVDVEAGQVVAVGARLGTMGKTGAAGGRHLHFSLQRGDTRGGGANGSIPIGALITADLSAGSPFERREGTSLRPGERTPWEGHLYGSETDANRDPIEGAPPPDLAAILEEGRRRLAEALAIRVRLAEISRVWRSHDPAWAEAELRPILARDPDQPVANYLFAVAVLRRTGGPDATRAALEKALAHNRVPHRHETWLDAWTHVGLGALAVEAGDRAAAQRHFEEAARRSTQRKALETALEHIRLLDAGAPR